MAAGKASRAAALAVAAATVAAALPAPGPGPSAAPLTTRPMNVIGPALTAPRTIDFLFGHRFRRAGTKVTNTPTFELELGLLRRLALGARYATSSDVFPGRTNEWEPYLKVGVLEQARQAIDLALAGGYNSAARSADGALLLGRRIGPLSLIAEARGLADGFGAGGPTFAAGGGALVHLTRFLALGGDVGRVIAARDQSDLPDGWDRWSFSAGLVFEIPYSPHSLSLYATNGNTRTFQGTSRGTRDVRFGFELSVPFSSLARWVAIVKPPPPPPPPPPAATAPPAAAAPAATVEVAIDDFDFGPATLTVAPGTVVTWVNRDRVPHTATAEDRSWDSGVFRPGESWSRRFDERGSFPYTCTLHPMMRGRIDVR